MTEPTLFIFFGATGDLAKRKLYPSLFRLYQKGLIKENFAVIGTARRSWTNEYYHEVIAEALTEFEASQEEIARFSSHFYYRSHDVTDSNHYLHLKELIDSTNEKYQLNGNRVFYFAMAPTLFGTIVSHLKKQQILSKKGFNRVVIEKPFGFDLESAQELNNEIRKVFEEKDIFRIDHYLGKEMIQNISAIRFTNNIFESLWNNRYIDNIQITFSEALGVEERGGYYDSSGALRDMVQNHVLQVISLLAMEAPSTFFGEAIRIEKVKVLEAIRLSSEEEFRKTFVRGQYGTGRLGAEVFTEYRQEMNIESDSDTETFVAGKFMIDNFRWSDVPFYIRTGKRMTEKGTRINIIFKQLPINLFEIGIDQDLRHTLSENVLTIYIQPTEGFSLTLNGKRIGQGFETHPIRLDYRHNAEMIENSPEAYERLVYDVISGDSTNFSHWDEVEYSWRIIDQIRRSWENEKPVFPNYDAGTMGPKAAFELLEKDGRKWFWSPDHWYRKQGFLK